MNTGRIEHFLKLDSSANQLIFSESDGIRAYMLDPVQSKLTDVTLKSHIIADKMYPSSWNVIYSRTDNVPYESGMEDKLFTLSNQCYMDKDCKGVAMTRNTTTNTVSTMLLRNSPTNTITGPPSDADTSTGTTMYLFPPELVERRERDIKQVEDNQYSITHMIYLSNEVYRPLLSTSNSDDSTAVRNIKTLNQLITYLESKMPIGTNTRRDISVVFGKRPSGELDIFVGSTVGTGTPSMTTISSSNPSQINASLNNQNTSIPVVYSIHFTKNYSQVAPQPSATPVPVPSVPTTPAVPSIQENQMPTIYIGAVSQPTPVNMTQLQQYYKKLESYKNIERFNDTDTVSASLDKLPQFDRTDSLSMHTESRQNKDKEDFLDYSGYITTGQPVNTPITTFYM